MYLCTSQFTSKNTKIAGGVLLDVSLTTYLLAESNSPPKIQAMQEVCYFNVSLATYLFILQPNTSSGIRSWQEV